jgi:hypothetical protein
MPPWLRAAVRLAGGATVTPAAWLSLSGRPQPRGPDRNTRGWIDAAGNRHWLDVFAGCALGRGAWAFRGSAQLFMALPRRAM